MKEIVKEHSLRPIVLRFDIKKKQPEFETDALAAYYAMHDNTWKIRQELIDRQIAFDELMDEIADLEFPLLPIEQELEFVEAAAGLRDQTELPWMEGQFTINLEELQISISEHNEAMQLFYPKLKEAWTWFDQHAEFIYEHESWITDEQDNLVQQLYERYEEVSVDIVSLDRDQQEFFVAYADVELLQDDYFNQGELVFAHYDKVLNRSDGIYRRFERAATQIREQYGGKAG